MLITLLLLFLAGFVATVNAAGEITVTPAAPNMPTNFIFTETFITGPYTLGYVWSWGDGTTDTTSTPTTSHTYTAPGTYSVTLTVYGTLEVGGWDVAPVWDTTYGTYYATATIEPTLTIMQPANRTYSSGNIPVAITTTATLTYYNVWNGTSWLYTNTTYAGATTLTGVVSGTYMFIAVGTVGSQTVTENVNFTVGTIPTSNLPAVNTDNIWLFFQEGNFLGAFQALIVAVFFSVETAVAVIVFLFMLPLYLRTKSVLLLAILWLLIGSIIIAATPLSSGLAVFFFIMGVGGLMYRLFKGGN